MRRPQKAVLSRRWRVSLGLIASFLCHTSLLIILASIPTPQSPKPPVPTPLLFVQLTDQKQTKRQPPKPPKQPQKRQPRSQSKRRPKRPTRRHKRRRNTYSKRKRRSRRRPKRHRPKNRRSRRRRQDLKPKKRRVALALPKAPSKRKAPHTPRPAPLSPKPPKKSKEPASPAPRWQPPPKPKDQVAPGQARPAPKGLMSPSEQRKAQRDIARLFGDWNRTFATKHNVQIGNYAFFYRQVTARLTRCWSPLKQQVRKTIHRHNPLLRRLSRFSIKYTGTLELKWRRSSPKVELKWSFRSQVVKMALYNIKGLTPRCLSKLRPTKRTLKRGWKEVKARWRFAFILKQGQRPGRQQPQQPPVGLGLPQHPPGAMDIMGVITAFSEQPMQLSVYPEAIFKVK